MGERKSFLLRVDPQVHDALKRWAEDELRSLNAQAEVVLREALRRAGRLPREEARAAESEAQSEPPTPSGPPDSEESDPSDPS
jgi:hypothetical protein